MRPLLRGFLRFVASVRGAQGAPSGAVSVRKRSRAELSRCSPTWRIAGVRSRARGGEAVERGDDLGVVDGDADGDAGHGGVR